MKGIIFKLILVFSITLIISASFGVMIIVMDENGSLNYTVGGANQTDYNIKTLSFKLGLLVFVILNISLSGFYITNIIILITTYKATMRIENKDIIYQRDLSNDYNSAIASYLIDGTVEAKQDYQAVLVELQEKGLIYKENEQYKVGNIEKNVEEELLLNQKTVLDQIMLNRINFSQFKKAVVIDARNLGYTKFNSALVILLFINPLGFFMFLYMVFTNSPLIMALTLKGKKEKDKIIKLKNYLINFSSIHELETSDNNIWGEYLAYAISLNVNKSLKVKGKLW